MEFYLAALISCILVRYCSTQCMFDAKNGATEAAKARLSPLVGLRFEVKDNNVDPNIDSYAYSIGICTDAEEGSQSGDYAGVIQTKLSGSDGTQGTKVVVGRYNATEVMVGTNWLFLEYENGKNYHEKHCGGEPRRANIFFTCAMNEKNGFARIVEENHDKREDCYYLFEIQHVAVCPVPENPGLSVGSVIVIIVLVLAAVYLVGGFLFQRFYAGAKGLEQIPNYSFWRDFGHLQADGCNLICRCGELTSEPRQYRGLGDDQLDKEIDFTVDEDENLLPM